MDIRLLALDPGKTTGWCCDPPVELLETNHGQVEPDKVWLLLCLYKPTHIVMETFVFRQAKSRINLVAVEVIGIVKEWARQYHAEVFEQTPSQAKHYFTDDRLKNRGLYFPGEQHARDAARHLCYIREFGALSGMRRKPDSGS